MTSLAANLDGFKLVVGLDALAVEVSLVAHKIGEGVGIGKEAAAHLPPDGIKGYRLGLWFAEGALRVLSGYGLEVDVYHLGFVANSAVKPPDEGGYAFGEDGFEVAVGVEAVDDATAEGVPVGHTFEADDDWGWGADAVFGGVAAGGSLTGFGMGTALGDMAPPGECLRQAGARDGGDGEFVWQKRVCGITESLRTDLKRTV